MKKFLRVIAVVMAMSLLVLTFGACGSSGGSDTSSKAEEKTGIIGSWEYETGGYTYTFNDDGTGSYAVGENKMEFTYKDNGKAVEILYTGNTDASTYEYKIDGDMLTIKDSLGNDVKYKKK